MLLIETRFSVILFAVLCVMFIQLSLFFSNFQLSEYDFFLFMITVKGKERKRSAGWEGNDYGIKITNKNSSRHRHIIMTTFVSTRCENKLEKKFVFFVALHVDPFNEWGRRKGNAFISL